MKNLSFFLISTTMLVTFSCASSQGREATTGRDQSGVVAKVNGTKKNAALGAGNMKVPGSVTDPCVLDAEELKKLSGPTKKRLAHGDILTLSDIIAMHQVAIPQNKIIGLIKKTNSQCCLSKEDKKRLKNAKVSRKVVKTLNQCPGNSCKQ